MGCLGLRNRMITNTTKTQDNIINRIINNNQSNDDILFLLDLIEKFDSKIEKQKEQIESFNQEIQCIKDKHYQDLNNQEEFFLEKIANFKLVSMRKDAPKDVQELINEHFEDLI